MKDVVILNFADRLERDAESPEVRDGSPEAAVDNAHKLGVREAKQECADALRMLVRLLGDGS